MTDELRLAAMRHKTCGRFAFAVGADAFENNGIAHARDAINIDGSEPNECETVRCSSCGRVVLGLNRMFLEPEIE